MKRRCFLIARNANSYTSPASFNPQSQLYGNDIRNANVFRWQGIQTHTLSSSSITLNHNSTRTKHTCFLMAKNAYSYTSPASINHNHHFTRTLSRASTILNHNFTRTKSHALSDGQECILIHFLLQVSTYNCNFTKMKRETQMFSDGKEFILIHFLSQTLTIAEANLQTWASFGKVLSTRTTLFLLHNFTSRQIMKVQPSQE